MASVVLEVASLLVTKIAPFPFTVDDASSANAELALRLTNLRSGWCSLNLDGDHENVIFLMPISDSVRTELLQLVCPLSLQQKKSFLEQEASRNFQMGC